MGQTGKKINQLVHYNWRALLSRPQNSSIASVSELHVTLRLFVQAGALTDSVSSLRHLKNQMP
jgi:hypothetical protein